MASSFNKYNILKSDYFKESTTRYDESIEPHFTPLTQRSEIPEPVLTWIREEFINCPNPNDIKIQNLGQPKVIRPKDSMLHKIAAHYSGKYGIEIHYCELDELDDWLKKEHSDHPVGIVVKCNKDATVSHVTPILLYQKEAIILDSIGAAGTPEMLVQKLMDHSFESHHSMIKRQADCFSCRLESCILLRNALIDLKCDFTEMEQAGEKKSILKKTERIPDSELPEERSHLAYRLPQVRIPPEWDYISQATNRSERASTAILPKDRLAKRPDPRTVAAFRQEYASEYEIRYRLQKKITSKDAIPTPQLPAFFNVKSQQDRKTLSLYWSCKKRANAYLAQKGLRWVQTSS